MTQKSHEFRIQDTKKQCSPGKGTYGGFEDGWHNTQPGSSQSLPNDDQDDDQDDEQSDDHSPSIEFDFIEFSDSSVSSCSDIEDYTFGFIETSESSDSSFDDDSEIQNHLQHASSSLPPPPDIPHQSSGMTRNRLFVRKRYVRDPSKALKSYDLLSRSEKWKRKKRFSRLTQQTLIDLHETGNTLFEAQNDLAKKVIQQEFKVMFPDYANAVDSNTPDRIAKYATEVVQEFRDCSKKSYRRVLIASKLFDNRGNLVLFEDPREARQGLKCCDSTLKRARVHAEVHGPGVAGKKIKHSRKSTIQAMV